MEERVPGDRFVYLTDNREDSRVVRIDDNKQFKWRKTPIPIKEIAKHPFYTLLEVGNMKLTAVEWEFEEEECVVGGEQEQEMGGNRQIFVIEQAQKLNIDQIERKKKELRPEELIGQLIENNEQFVKRTEYSKQKYVKKKQRKYMFRLHAEPVTLANLHRHYFKSQKEAVCGIRWDMFALMLLHGGPYKRVLMGEQGRGLLIGALLQRNAQEVTAGVGKPLSLKQFPLIQQLNCSKDKQEKVDFIEWGKLKESGKKFDNFLLMGNYDFLGLVDLAQPMLQIGCLLAFFSPSLSPLEHCGRVLKQRGYLSIRLFDSWCREYQVLRNRTHPLMSMDSCSGFLLVGVFVGVA